MPRTEYRYPANGPAYRVTVGCDYQIADEAQVPAALDKIGQAMIAATTEQCEGWLVMLQAATAHRADSEVSSAVAYGLFAAELRQWPADVAKAACLRLARGKPGHTGTNWFPTLAELVAECERFASPRKAMLAGLRNWAPKAIRAPTARGIPEPTEADKAAVHKMAVEASAELLAAASRMMRRPSGDLPSIAGKPDAGGLTPEMRELIARRQQQAAE